MSEGGQSTRRRTTVIVVLAALLALAAFSWVVEGLVAEPGEAGSVIISRDGHTLATFTIDELRELPAHEVRQLGKLEQGPAVLDVLQAAGVTDFERMTVVGLGMRDDGELLLERSQVTDEVVLDFAYRGTVKIAGPGIAWEDRVRDVTELRVE